MSPGRDPPRQCADHDADQHHATARRYHLALVAAAFSLRAGTVLAALRSAALPIAVGLAHAVNDAVRNAAMLGL